MVGGETGSPHVRFKMKLYNYQELDISSLVEHLKNNESCAIMYATGSGKTIVARTVATLLRLPTVVAAPTNNIKSSFTSKKTVSLDNKNIKLFPMKEFKDGQKARLDSYLQEELFPGFGVVVSHQLLSGFETQSCANKLLIVDEAHHAGEKQNISGVIKSWQENGGLVLYLTATPIRANNEPSLASQAQFKVVRTISQQMRENFAPADIEFDLVCIDSKVYDTSDKVFGAPMDVQKLIQELHHQLRTDGFPKTIIRCKSLGSANENDEVIESISEYLKEQGLRVLPATSRTQLSDLEIILEKERSLESISDSELDVVVGIQAVCEGLDWPLASHFYFIGVPTTIPLTIQGVGRTMRKRNWEDKLLDYPVAWNNTSKVVMITGNVREIKSKHTSSILRVISYLGSLKQLPIMEVIKERFNNRIHTDDAEADVVIEYPINEEALPLAIAAVIEIQNTFYKNVHADQRLSRNNIRDIFLFLQSEGKYKECSVQDIAVAIASNTKKDREEFTERFDNNLPKILPSDARQDIRQAYIKTVEEFMDDTVVLSGEVFGKIQTIHVDSDVIDVFAKQVETIKPSKVSWDQATS